MNSPVSSNGKRNGKKASLPVCMCGCGREFVPKVRTQLYFDRKCKNLAGIRRWRQAQRGLRDARRLA